MLCPVLRNVQRSLHGKGESLIIVLFKQFKNNSNKKRPGWGVTVIAKSQDWE